MEPARNDGADIIDCPRLAGPSERMEQAFRSIPEDKAVPAVRRDRKGAGLAVVSGNYVAVRRNGPWHAPLTCGPKIYHAILCIPTKRNVFAFSHISYPNNHRAVRGHIV